MLLASLLAFVTPVPMVADDKYGEVGGWTIRKRDGACYMFGGSGSSQVLIVTETLKSRQLTVEFLDADWRFQAEPKNRTGYRLTVHGQNGKQYSWNDQATVFSQHKSGAGSIALTFETEPTKRLQDQLAGATRLVLSWSGPTAPDKIWSDRPVAMKDAIQQLDDCARWFS